MRCQRSQCGAGLNFPKFSVRFLVLLAPVLLAGCLDEEPRQRQAVQDTNPFPSIGDRINRSGKGDRLVIPVRAQRPSLADARARAHNRIAPYGTPLSGFYRALIALQSGVRQDPVTILHLGDSHIASDSFSGDLREKFQARFGDAGRGMMMPGFPFPYYRARGVTFARKGKWTAANSFTKDPGPYGLSGVRVSARDTGARLSLTSAQGAFEWAEVAFLTQAKGGAATVSFGGAQQQVETGGATRNIQRVRIARKGRRLEIKTKSAAPVSILSLSVGNNRPGIRYVNFGIPGATADTPRRWDPAFVADDLARLKPDLIVLGYGTNEGFNDGLDPDAYAARVTELVKRLQGDAPKASFLVLGPPDGGRLPRFARKSAGDKGPKSPCRALSETERRDYASLRKAKSSQLARWHPPPKLSAVRASLRGVAERRGAYFWDWSRVMNGPCGIHSWANADPPLAARDNVHLRSAGAKRSASALFDELMAGYEAHAKLASR